MTHVQSMHLWHRVMLAMLEQELPDLTARQFALLLHVYLGPPPHTVRGLAARLKMSKPAVTRALDRLSALGFIERKGDRTDKRSIVVSRTVAGAVFLRDFADMAADLAETV
jgi:DNA-binding MarR family transcriptional regulator